MFPRLSVLNAAGRPVARLFGRRMFRDSLWNLFGTVVPMAGALFAVPVLLNALGTARFGLLSLAWVIVGYFSLFDLGLGRAVTQLVSRKLEQGRNSEVPLIVGTALSLMSILGAVGALVLLIATPLLVSRGLALSPELQDEARTGFIVLSLAIPILVATSCFRAVLEAYQRFDLVNIVRLPLGLAMYLAPLAVLPISNSIGAIFASLLIVRVLSLAAFAVTVRKSLPAGTAALRLESSCCRELLAFGGWMTVSNVVGPLLLYLGRFFVAAMVSAEAVAYFSTPYDVVANLLILPGILVTVLIPALSRAFENDRGEARALYRTAVGVLFLVLAPLCLLVCVVAFPALSMWLGREFAVQSYVVAQLIAVGVLINGFGHVSQSVVQCFGRPDLTAKLHLIELVTYVPYLAVLTREYGIDGAAFAWVVRVLISTLALSWLARKCLDGAIAGRY